MDAVGGWWANNQKGNSIHWCVLAMAAHAVACCKNFSCPPAAAVLDQEHSLAEDRCLAHLLWAHPLAAYWACLCTTCCYTILLYMPQAEIAMGYAESNAKVRILGKNWGMCSTHCQNVNTVLCTTALLIFILEQCSAQGRPRPAACREHPRLSRQQCPETRCISQRCKGSA